MKRTLRLFATGVFALLVCMPAVYAQTPETSRLPVTEPLDVGGTILEPGNYIIRLAPVRSNRDTVQVLSEDGSKVIATVMTVPHYFEPGEETPNSMFVYFPSGDGAPRALRTWFARFPEASQGGHDIVYSESRAKQLARLAKQDVVFTTPDTTTLSVVTPESTVEVYTPPSATITMTTETTVETTTPAPTPVTETETTVETTETEPMVSSTETETPEMPSTASRIPLMALLGLASLIAAVAIRIAR